MRTPLRGDGAASDSTDTVVDMTDVLDRLDPLEGVQTRRVRRPGPHRRPPVGLRVLAGVLGLGASLFTVALMLSDRAPGVLKALFGDRARRFWERIDASGRADFVTADRVPESDNLVHIAVWAIVMLLVAMTVWSWRWLVVAAPMVIGASAVVEVGQGRWAETRSVEASDIVANGLGVCLGVAAAALLYLAWSAVLALIRPDN